MTYYGGRVQVHPKEYLVYWGWGQSGAWPSGTTCSPKTITEGSLSATLACDPDGAGKYTADFLAQAGGTSWAGVSTQYYETDSSATQTAIANDPNLLAGIWVDDSDRTRRRRRTRATPPGRPTRTRTGGAGRRPALRHHRCE